MWPFTSNTQNSSASATSLTSEKQTNANQKNSEYVSSNSTSKGSGGCPIDHSSLKGGSTTTGILSSASASILNPRNQMPDLPQFVAPNQRVILPTQRTTSSIPKAVDTNAVCPMKPGEISSSTPGYESDEGKWEYPSPQQFYNALVRKGWETPEEHVEMMVEIHNWLNEAAWDEVMKWESLYDFKTPPALLKFQGKPQQLSPRAWMFTKLGQIFPSKFDSTPPFDRHDWTIKREDGTLTRYVIDYYSAQTDENGNPVFHLDVRPALDSLDNVVTRIKVATAKTWENFMAEN